MFSEIGDASKIVLNKFRNWFSTIIEMLPNFIIAVVVLISFYLLSRLIRKILDKVLHRITSNKSVIKLIKSISSFLIVLIGLMVALGVLKLEKTVTSVLAGVGVVGLALGFAFQDAAANLISGVIMAVKSPINVNDIVKSNEVFGTVKKIGLRATTIYDPSGQDVIIPNRLIFQNIYKHYTVNGIRRVDLECGISYGDDLKKVKKLSIEAIKKIPYLLEGREVEFYYKEFGSSSINFVVRYWINFRTQPDYLSAQSEGVINLKEAFDNNGITIPFPIRTLDFGIKGGEKLSEVWTKKD